MVAPRTNKRILIVDDQHIVTRLLTTILHQLGFAEVAVARDGEAALAQLRTAPFDALISDVKMEPMSGLHLVAAIRKDERLEALPVILMTGSNDVSLVLAAKRLRANGFLTKPFSPQALREQLLRLMPAA